MVMPMVGRPPQHAFLCGCHREERQDKLEYPAGLERAMGKIAVIPRRDGNHSQIIAADSQQNPFPLNPGLKGQEAHQMDAQKWNDVPILNKILPGPAYEGTVGVMGRSVHTETVVPSATPRVVTVRDLSLSLPRYNDPSQPGHGGPCHHSRRSTEPIDRLQASHSVVLLQ